MSGGAGPKRRGTVLELRSMRWLEAQGYQCTRSGGSLGLYDVIGVGPDDIMLVQVKGNAGAPPAERQAMAASPAPLNAYKVIHRWRRGNAKAPMVEEIQ